MYPKPTWVRFALVGIAMLFLCSCKPKDPSNPDGSAAGDASGTSSVGGGLPSGSDPSGSPWDPSNPDGSTTGDPSAPGSDGSSAGPGSSSGGGSSTTSGGPGGNPNSSTGPTNPGEDPEPPARVYVTPFGRLNTTDKTINSHEGDEGASSLELDFRGYTEVTPSTLTVSAANYPRIKKLPNGQYILFWHNNSVGANVFYTRSSDLKNWEPVKKVFEATPITVNGQSDERSYSNADALVLQNGELMVVASFRAKNHFRKDNAYNGIMMRKSSDNGQTWSDEQVIYRGSNWEPQILQLPSGEIQVYFTHSGAKSQMQIEMGWTGDNMVASSGTAIARSYDNGKTWKANQPDSYAGYAISQRYIDTVRGIKVFTDQMPCALLLNKYNTIAVAMESKVFYGVDYYNISVAYSDDNWARTLGIDEEGPSDKQKDLWNGGAPYLKQFPSGETILSYNAQNVYQIRLGDAKARKFYNPCLPFGEEMTGVWGSLELDGSHTVIGTVQDRSSGSSHILIGRMNLNHTLYAGNMTPAVDGDNKDWAGNTEAFFVGSESQAQASVRMSYDKDNLYLLVERLDYDLLSQDTVDVYLNPSTQGLGGNSLRLTVGPNGLQQTARYSGGRWKDETVPGAEGKALLRGTVGGSSDQDEGYAVEVVIPRTAIQANASTLRCALTLYNQDKGTSRIEDGLDSVSLSQPTSWLKVRLG